MTDTIPPSHMSKSLLLIECMIQNLSKDMQQYDALDPRRGELRIRIARLSVMSRKLGGLSV